TPKGEQKRQLIRAIFLTEDEKHHAYDDATVRSKKADESPILKTKTQVGSEHCLERSTDSPEIRHLKPALISGPHRHNDDDHSPVAELQGQHLLPRQIAVTAHKN